MVHVRRAGERGARGQAGRHRDRENRRIQIFDADGNYLRQWKDLGTPFGIDIAADRSIYIRDARGRRFFRLKPDGTVVGAHGKEGEMPGQLGLGPHHLAVTAEGIVYSTEIPNLRVQKFVPAGSFPE